MPENSKFELVSSVAPDYFLKTNPSSNAVTASEGSSKPGISVPEPKRERKEASSLLRGI